MSPREQVAKETRALIEGRIEAVSSDGVVWGWVKQAGARTPAHVQITLAGQLIAEAIADAFRAELLRAGHGHGHHGFTARLRRPLPPGVTAVLMHLPEPNLSAPMQVNVPPLTAPRIWSVEELLVHSPSWRTADLLAHPDCLDMRANHARLGTEAFIDAVFQFVLRRWPSPAEISMNSGSLDSGRITPQAMLLDYLAGRERADMPPALASPFDPDFPFLA